MYVSIYIIIQSDTNPEKSRKMKFIYVNAEKKNHKKEKPTSKMYNLN